jgi:hypothetical protein
MNPLPAIETNCRRLAALRAQLRKKFEARQNAQNVLDAAHSPGIRDLQDQCRTLRAALLDQLALGRALFLTRKTLEFHGITVGFEKERDQLTLPPEEILVDRIEKMLPAAQGRTLLASTVKIIKHAFKKLPADTLQKLGCAVIKGGDKTVVRANDDDIEALVQKSLGDPAPAAAPALPTR